MSLDIAKCPLGRPAHSLPPIFLDGLILGVSLQLFRVLFGGPVERNQDAPFWHSVPVGKFVCASVPKKPLGLTGPPAHHSLVCNSQDLPWIPFSEFLL